MNAMIDLDQALIDAAPIVAQTLRNGSVEKNGHVTTKMMIGDVNLILHLLGKVAASKLCKQSNDQRINQNSLNVEFWTPLAIIEVARVLMGGIDLDPACSDAAWQFHGRHSKVHYAEDGLGQPWFGNVWMNHPFGVGEKKCKPNCKKKRCAERGYHIDHDVPGNKEWIDQLISACESGDAINACCITYASTSEAWFTPLTAWPQFWFQGRVNYIDPLTRKPKKGVPKGSVFTWVYSRKLNVSYQSACNFMQATFEKFGYRGVAK